MIMFKIGDKVKAVETPNGGRWCGIRGEGIVRLIQTPPCGTAGLTGVDFGMSGFWYITPNKLELVEKDNE